MEFPALLASVVSGVVTAAGWVAHRVHSLGVTTRTWTCLECQVPNELDRDTCWSCGAGYGQDPVY
ncbi:MAG TPA: hypothetical protein HA326_08290, partial [Thermoplasmata archaeon]|nr:hypothetical protein [Thermoplasmata archaeon]